MNIESLLQQAAKKNHLDFSADIFAKFAAFLALIHKWNRVFNLTTILAPHDMVYLHIIDSLQAQPYLHGNKILDVGSGAGIPGIPLAIINPGKQFTLLDKNNKKTRFMTQAVAELQLKNVTIVHSRTEEFHPAQGFDSILSRAFGSLDLFTQTTQHLLNDDGIWIAMKGKYPQQELNDLPADIEVQANKRIEIKGINIERHIICLRKKI